MDARLSLIFSARASSAISQVSRSCKLFPLRALIGSEAIYLPTRRAWFSIVVRNIVLGLLLLIFTSFPGLKLKDPDIFTNWFISLLFASASRERFMQSCIFWIYSFLIGKDKGRAS